MALDISNSVEIIETMENYLSKIRPEPKIRSKLDFSYEIERQSVILYEIRPFWNDESKITKSPYAKATFVKSTDTWKIYWMRANNKWDLYDPTPSVGNLNAFLKIVEEDKHGCFYG